MFRQNINFLLSERSGTSKIRKLAEFYCLASSGKVRSSELKPILWVKGGILEILVNMDGENVGNPKWWSMSKILFFLPKQ